MADAAEAMAAEVFDTPADEATPEAGAKEASSEAKGTNEVATDAAKPADEAPTPWWERAVPGKWKDEDSAIKGYAESSKEARRLADEFKAASEKAADLEGKWKGIESLIGAPVDAEGKPAPYDIKLPEGASVDPVLKGMAENFMREHNLSGDFAQKAFEGIFVNYESAIEHGLRELEKDTWVKALGDGDEAAATARAKDGFAWAARFFASDPDKLETLRECGNRGAAVNVLAWLKDEITRVGPGRSMGTDDAIAFATSSDREKAISDPRYNKDQAYTDSVNLKLNAAFPGGGPKEQDS